MSITSITQDSYCYLLINYNKEKVINIYFLINLTLKNFIQIIKSQIIICANRLKHTYLLSLQINKTCIILRIKSLILDYNIQKMLLKAFPRIRSIYLKEKSFNIHNNTLFCFSSAVNQGSNPRCMVLHPVLYPNKGPIVQQYLAQQAIGLASSLRWEIIQGPFWKIKKKRLNHPPLKRNEIYMEPLYGNKQIRDGTYVNSTLGKGMAYGDGIMFDADETDDDADLYKQWQNKLMRQSLANSSLVKCKRVTQKFYFTKGKVQKIVQHIMQNRVDCIFINSQLKPGQIRNLRKIVQARVNGTKLPKGYGLSGGSGGIQQQSETELDSVDQQSNTQQSAAEASKKSRFKPQFRRVQIFDRFSIILQIFAQRSTSKLAKLQIELSYLTYLKTRLVREGSTYSSNLNFFSGNLMKARQFSLQIISAKQRRALGTMTGEGQSQLQIERRNIRSKQAKIRKQIEELNRLREIKKEKDKQNMTSIPIIALVGYTNVGKSALMNYLMKKEEVSSKDLLFETLKTTSRHIVLPSGRKVMLLDTIGFITNLPVEMVDSFKATLEDISHANLVIHLRDISHPQNQLQKHSVIKILKQLNFDQQFYDKKMIEVWNKTDLLKNKSPQIGNKNQEEDEQCIKISCKTGLNIRNLLSIIDQKLKLSCKVQTFTVEYSGDKHYKVMQWLKQNANYSHQMQEEYIQNSKQFPNGSIKLSLQIDEPTYWKLMKYLDGLGDGKVLSKQNRKIMKQKKQRKKQKGMPPKEGW